MGGIGHIIDNSTGIDKRMRGSSENGLNPFAFSGN